MRACTKTGKSEVACKDSVPYPVAAFSKPYY